jgi:hypothetical protein
MWLRRDIEKWSRNRKRKCQPNLTARPKADLRRNRPDRNTSAMDNHYKGEDTRA